MVFGLGCVSAIADVTQLKPLEGTRTVEMVLGGGGGRVDIEQGAIQERDQYRRCLAIDGATERLLEARIELLLVEFGTLETRGVDVLIGLHQRLVGTVP